MSIINLKERDGIGIVNMENSFHIQGLQHQNVHTIPVNCTELDHYLSKLSICRCFGSSLAEMTPELVSLFKLNANPINET